MFGHSPRSTQTATAFDSIHSTFGTTPTPKATARTLFTEALSQDNSGFSSRNQSRSRVDTMSQSAGSEARESSGRASPAPGWKQSLSQQAAAPAAATLSRSGLSVYDSRSIANALERADHTGGLDTWQAICVRTLPLFNGEGFKGYIEDINKRVASHVEAVIQGLQPRASQSNPAQFSNVSSLATGILTESLTDLMATGCLTLSSKLLVTSPTPPLSDDKLLAKLNEIWSMYWSSVIPQLEGIFWPLRGDDRLRANVGGSALDREREGVTEKEEGRIDVRKIALIAFRDHLILPIAERLRRLFKELYAPRPLSGSTVVGQEGTPQGEPVASTSAVPNDGTSHLRPAAPSDPRARGRSTSPFAAPAAPAAPPTAATVAANSRRRQMMLILGSVLSGDDRQEVIEDLLSVIRGAKHDRAGVPSGSERGESDGFGGGAASIYEPSLYSRRRPALSIRTRGYPRRAHTGDSFASSFGNGSDEALEMHSARTRSGGARRTRTSESSDWGVGPGAAQTSPTALEPEELAAIELGRDAEGIRSANSTLRAKGRRSGLASSRDTSYGDLAIVSPKEGT